MNYFYPLSGFDPDDVGGIDRAAFKVYEAGAICLVALHGDDDEEPWGLALTGGGMNLAWDICAAYVALGYLPPLYFCDSLPNLAGITLNNKRRRILAACRRTCIITHQFVNSTAGRVKRLRQILKANTEARKQEAA